jgi:hypothetical protein
MKRLSVFVSILILSLGLFGGIFSPEKVVAQGVSTVSTENQESLYAKGVAIFETAVADTLAKKTSANTVGSDNFVKIINEGKDVYTKSFNDAIAVKRDIYTSYNSALLVARKDIYEKSREDIQIVNKGVDYNTILKNLQTASTARRNELLASGDTSGTASLDESTRRTQNALTEAGKNGGAPLKTGSKCSIANGFSLVACIDEGVTWIIKNILLQIGGFLVWLTANMFNYAVEQGILQFSQWAPNALYPIWTIVRQIISLVIVFVGLYLGFMYILGKEDKFEKYIPWVVMFGLFVNFSYPLTRTIIDISNITALNIYASAIGPDALTSGFTSQNTAGALIMAKLGLQDLVGSAVSTENLGILKNVNSIPGALIAVAYVFYAAYIFFRVTLIILMRTVALVFIIIASPLLLVDSVLPMLGDKAKELRGIFFNQLIVGPVFMIMLALTLKFLDVFAMADVSGGATEGENIKVFFNIFMMFGMLHIMIEVTKKFSFELGAKAAEALGTVSGIGLGMASGGLGILGRQGIGRLAANAQNRGWVSKDPNSMGGRIANTLSTSTFDLRNSSVVAGGTARLGMNKGFLGMGGMGGGSASKASFQTNADAKAKRIEASAKARFKTKYERDVLDQNGKVIHRKGDDNDEEIKAREEFMASKGGSIFLTKDQQQKITDSETDTQADRSLAEHNKLKTKDDKEKNLTKLKQDLEASKLSDPKLESAKSQAFARTIHDIEKKDTEEKETFDKKVTEAVDIYEAKTGKDRDNYFSNQTKDVREKIKEAIDKKAQEASASTAPITTFLPASTVSATTSQTPTSTPPVQNVFAAKRAQAAEAARASMGEKTTSTQTEQPQVEAREGFLKTPEEKIREREARQQQEKEAEATV